MPRAPNRRGIHLVKRQSADPEKNQQGALKPQAFHSGDIVPKSGVYRVAHAQHRLPHEVTLLHAANFPPCSNCGNKVTFQLLRPVTVDSFKVVLNSLPEIESTSAIVAADDLEESA
jgi:hypothetical protein